MSLSMSLDAKALHQLTEGSAAEAWRILVDRVLEITSAPLEVSNASSEVTRRDREIAALDYFLSSSAWDLWQIFGEAVERTSSRIVRWWGEPYSAKAVLLLDGLSM